MTTNFYQNTTADFEKINISNRRNGGEYVLYFGFEDFHLLVDDVVYNKEEWDRPDFIDFFDVLKFVNSKLGSPIHVSKYQKTYTSGVSGIRRKTNLIGSIYWQKDGHIYRLSDHWGYVGDCMWTLDGKEFYRRGYYLGKCKINDFIKKKITHD